MSYCEYCQVSSEPHQSNCIATILNDYPRISERLNITKNAVFLGKGVNGRAYKLNSKNALKVTFSQKEYENAEKLIGKQIKNVVKYYDAVEIRSRRERLFLIKMELLKPLSNLVYQEINEFVWDYFFYNRKLPVNSPIRKQIVNGFENLKNLGINHTDLHTGNVMQSLRSNQIKIIDIM